LREICRQEGMPAWQTVYDWMNRDENLSVAIARARELGQDAIAEDTLHIIDYPPERGQDGKIDPAWVQLQKARIEQRLKLLAKWNPKRQKVDFHLDLCAVSDGHVHGAGYNRVQDYRSD